ncbi:MAG: AhpC/TSA family protein [Blastocatellia bacterium]
MADIAGQREQLDAAGTQLAFVYMGTEEQGAVRFAAYGLGDVSRFADPGQKLYAAFDLQRAVLSQIFGWKVWRRGVEAFANGHGVGQLAGDGLQMPGVFLLHHGVVLREFRHETAADRPDYMRLARK